MKWKDESDIQCYKLILISLKDKLYNTMMRVNQNSEKYRRKENITG